MCIDKLQLSLENIGTLLTTMDTQIETLEQNEKGRYNAIEIIQNSIFSLIENENFIDKILNNIEHIENSTAEGLNAMEEKYQNLEKA